MTEIVAITAGLISSVLCFYLATKLRLSLAFGLTVVIVALISPHFLARPVILSYLLLSVWMVLILEIEDHDNWSARQGFMLIPVMLLWANVHGGFTFGLAIFYLFLCNAIWDAYKKKEPRRLLRLLVLLIGVSVAAMITPYGPISTLKTFNLMSDPALATIDEWRAPDFQNDPFHLVAIVAFRTRCVFRHSAARSTAAYTIAGDHIRSRAQTWAWPVCAGSAANPRPTTN